jgi:NAD(P)-dependent dehydrogenase (short-subunit alcohol dehydrogenase family)
MTSATEKLVDLTGLKALVTGGGSGIGRTTAQLLASVGAHVCVLDMNMEAAGETARLIASEGGQAEARAVDVTSHADVARAIADAELDILVNAAGIVVRKTLLETTHDEWQRVIDVNLTGYFNVLKAAVPALARSRTGGRVVQIASVSALVGYGYPAYTASKGGVLAMTRQLAAELAPMGIRINSISPGVTETNINRDTLNKNIVRTATIGNTPLARLGLPRDIAKAVLYLVSDMGEFVTGTDIVVDGGMISTIHWGEASKAIQRAHE